MQRARVSVCRRSISSFQQETRAYFAKHKKASAAPVQAVGQDLRRLADANIPTRRSCSTTRSQRKCRPICSRRSRTSPPTRSSPRARPGSDVLAAARRRSAAAHQRQRRSVRLHAELHQGGKDFSRDNRTGRNIRFGIREHGMCAHHERHRLRRPLPGERRDVPRLCRLLPRPRSVSRRSRSLPIIYIFTHDSVGVGEDGPTHQPVETVSGLRVIPNLDVIRPADPEETAGAFAAALAAHRRSDAARADAAGRADVERYRCQAAPRRRGAGGYIAHRETARSTRSSSRRQRTAARARGGERARRRRARRLDAMLRALRPPGGGVQKRSLADECRRRVAIEAGVIDLWFKYVGLDGKVDRPPSLRLKRSRRSGDERVGHRCSTCDRRGPILVNARVQRRVQEQCHSERSRGTPWNHERQSCGVLRLRCAPLRMTMCQRRGR